MEADKNNELKNQADDYERQLAELRAKMEQSRISYEKKIDELTLTIEEKVKIIKNKESNILSLEELLAKKHDVEAQLDEALKRE